MKLFVQILEAVTLVGSIVFVSLGRYDIACYWAILSLINHHSAEKM